MTMTMSEMKTYHGHEVTKLGGTVTDNHGYRMDVNLWFRHKNEALFYLDSVGKVHGPMDQTYSIRLGPIQKSGKEIALKKEFFEESEKEKWRTCNEFQNAKPTHFREETKHIETLLKDVSSSNINNCQRSFLTTATHYIPKPSRVEIGNYTTSITKQRTRDGVTVNLKAPPIQVIQESNIREKRLIDELLEARNELNTLRRTKSVIDTSLMNDHSTNYLDEKYVSKVVTGVQPTLEKVRTQHLSSRQEYQSRPDWEFKDTTVPKVQPRHYHSNHHLSEETSRETFINERQMAPVSTYSARKENMKSQQMLDERNIGSRTLQTERNMGQRNEMTEEIETITLQPIGKGVQDLAPPPGASLSRPMSRAATPKVFESGTVRNNYYREESRQVGGYNTMPAMPKFAKANSVRNVNQTSNYDLVDFYKRGNSAHRVGNEQTQRSSFNRSTNEQVQGASFNRSSANENAYNASINRVSANDHAVNTMPNRNGNAQTINTSWHTRTESYSGGNRGYQAQMSPVSNQESFSSNVITSGDGDQRYNLQMVINAEDQWYQPSYSREDVINALKDKEQGSFYIRNSSTFTGAYGLALKVASLPDNVSRTNDPQSDLVRHFLIETVEDASGNGVRLKGFPNELVYPSLAHLVQAHCQNAIALPTNLILPHSSFIRMDHTDGSQIASKSQYQYEYHNQQQQQQQQQQQHQMGSSKGQVLTQYHRSNSSPGVNFPTSSHPNPLHQYLAINVMYLGKIEIDRLTGDEAIMYAVDKVMNKKPMKTSTVEIQLDSTKGITLTDKMQKLFYTRQIPAQHVLYAGFDPQKRENNSTLLQNNGINRGRIMGIVVKKQKIILRENVVHVFCELDRINNIDDVLTFIKENYLRR